MNENLELSFFSNGALKNLSFDFSRSLYILVIKSQIIVLYIITLLSC